MITDLRLENFKGHVDTSLSLRRLTMLVGDNGSGKSSVLEALRYPSDLSLHPEGSGLPTIALEVIRRGASRMKLSFQGLTRGVQWPAWISIELRSKGLAGIITGQDRDRSFDSSKDGYFGGPYRNYVRGMAESIGEVRLFRFRPEQVAASAYSDQPDAVVAEDGAQTAVVLAAMKLANDEVFERVEVAIRRLVPMIKRVRIKPATVRRPLQKDEVVGSKLYFDFQGAKEVPAHHASHGTLIALALLTVLHGPSRPAQILLDDFDQALHPRAQMELVRMLKELLELDDFKETQIIATTHSPYVLDELDPENVIAFALRDDGTVATKSLAEHPDAAKMKGSLKTGQLWSLDAERDWVLT